MGRAAPDARFVFLGTSGAVPSALRDTTSLAFAVPEGAVLVDCGGSPVQKLRRAGVDPLALAHLAITHVHPDHCYGLPSLVQNLLLLGREAPLAIHCRPEHVEPLEALLGVFRLRERPRMFPLTIRAVDLAPGARAFELAPLVFTTAPNDHGAMPNFAVRVDVRAEARSGGEASERGDGRAEARSGGEASERGDGRAEARSGGEASERGDGRAAARRRGVVYSSDTTPCESVVALARGADTLIHEATFPARHRGRFGAHSTAEEAGEVAARAGVRRLILTHIEADYHGEVDALAVEARKRFRGVVEVARELESYPL